MRTQNLVVGGIVAALLIYQVLFILSVPEPLVIAVAVLADLVLAGCALLFSSSARRTNDARYERVQQSLSTIFDLAREQQVRWLQRVETMAGVDADDQDLAASLERLLSARGALETHVKAGGETVESLIDVIQTMLLLNHALSGDLDGVLSFYQNTLGELQAYRNQNRLGHFRLHESVTFLGEMGAESSRYAERLVLDVLDSFQEITRFSQGISSDVSGTMTRLMDASNDEGLSAVRQQSVTIQTAMDELFRDLEQADAASETTVRENLTQMQRVQNIAQAIEDFSESIRMISLNLNIEAARSHGASGNGKAVQVLATKLSEFAVKAQELAAQQQEVVGTAARVLSQAGTGQRQQLSKLMAQIRPLKERLAPFSRIVSQTFEHFAEVEATMERLSSAIDSRLQAVIGKFQFQDLVRQEQEHVLALFTYVRDRAEAGGGEPLPDEQKRQALGDLLDTFEAMASTENEHRVIHAYRNRSSLSPVTERAEVAAGSVELF